MLLRGLFISPRKNYRTAKGHINDLQNSSSVAQSKALRKKLNSLILLAIKGARRYLEEATGLNEDWFVFMWDQGDLCSVHEHKGASQDNKEIGGEGEEWSCESTS